MADGYLVSLLFHGTRVKQRTNAAETEECFGAEDEIDAADCCTAVSNHSSSVAAFPAAEGGLLSDGFPRSQRAALALSSEREPLCQNQQCVDSYEIGERESESRASAASLQFVFSASCPSRLDQKNVATAIHKSPESCASYTTAGGSALCDGTSVPSSSSFDSNQAQISERLQSYLQADDLQSIQPLPSSAPDNDRGVSFGGEPRKNSERYPYDIRAGREGSMRLFLRIRRKATFRPERRVRANHRGRSRIAAVNMVLPLVSQSLTVVGVVPIPRFKEKLRA